MPLSAGSMSPTHGTVRSRALALLGSALLSGLLAPVPAARAAAVDEAIAVIERLQTALVAAALLAPDTDLAGRYEQLAPVVAETHDLATMGRLTVRRFWRDWSEAERAAFTDAFTRLSIMSYASRFSAVGPDTFGIVGGAEQDPQRVEVQSLVNRKDDDAVPIDYLLQLQDGSWRIINVFADGASELSLMAAEYYAILESGGFDALLAEIESRIAALQPPA
jgi:phospholipid transport system substrate-binding protein